MFGCNLVGQERQRTFDHFLKDVALGRGDFISVFRMDMVAPRGAMLSGASSFLWVTQMRESRSL